MTAVDKIGSAFLRAMLFRMKELGMNKSALARRMNVSRAYVTKLFELRNFAIKSETDCADVGSNAKMNELQAFMGLCCLKRLPDLLAKRRQIAAAYAEIFAGTKVKWLGKGANDAYCPVLFETAAQREKVYSELKEKYSVFSRRYFYPLLTDFAPYVYAKGTCPIAQDVASRVLTLPTYYDLAVEDAKAIAENVLEIVG